MWYCELRGRIASLSSCFRFPGLLSSPKQTGFCLLHSIKMLLLKFWRPPCCQKPRTMLSSYLTWIFINSWHRCSLYHQYLWHLLFPPLQLLLIFMLPPSLRPLNLNVSVAHGFLLRHLSFFTLYISSFPQDPLLLKCWLFTEVFSKISFLRNIY